MGNRGRNGNTTSRVGPMYRQRHGNKGYSQNASRVHAQVTKCQTDSEVIVKPGLVHRINIDGAPVMSGMSRPARGLAEYSETKLTVTTSAATGFGFMIIKWDQTGPLGGVLASGAGMNTAAKCCDVLYTDSTYGAANLPVSTTNVSTGTVGIAGVDSCNAGPAGTTIRDPNVSFGAYCYATLGQKIELLSNRAAVADREGSIIVVHVKGSLPATMDENTFQADTRSDTYDASNLTAASNFTAYRPPEGTGRFYCAEPGDRKSVV